MDLFEAIYSLAHRSALLDQIITFCAMWLPWLTAVTVIISVLVSSARERRPTRAKFIILVPIIAWLLSQLLKAIIHSPRPSLTLDTVEPLFKTAGNAFPSSHATIFFALAFALYPFHPRAATLVSISAIAISLARVAAGVHWPIDILGGFILAGLVALISWMIVKTRFPSLT